MRGSKHNKTYENVNSPHACKSRYISRRCVSLSLRRCRRSERTHHTTLTAVGTGTLLINLTGNLMCNLAHPGLLQDAAARAGAVAIAVDAVGRQAVSGERAEEG